MQLFRDNHLNSPYLDGFGNFAPESPPCDWRRAMVRRLTFHAVRSTLALIMPDSDTIREAIVEIGRRLDRRGLIAGTDGNISVRLESGRIVITPSGTHKGDLSSTDLIEVDIQGKQLSGDGRPSSEMLLHLHVYRARADIDACVHAHPPHATAFAVAGQNLPPDVLPEVVAFIGEIPLTAYAPPGTDAVPRSLEPFIENHQAFLLRNHGLLTVGRNLEEAYNRHETVEHFARILSVARQLGGINRLPEDDLRRLKEMHTKLIRGPI